MSSRRLVDPELLPFVDAAPNIVLSDKNLASLRARPPFPQPEPPSGIDLDRLEILAVAGHGIMLHIYRPADAVEPLPCIYHMHGGGMISGAASRVESRHRFLSHQLRCAIVSVDYRLAPETRFPGNIEDCYTGLAWVFSNAERLGIDTSRLGLMGESAGGTFAAALAILARDRGEYGLAFQHLIYPALDDRTGRIPGHPFAGEFLWTAADNVYAWDALLGPGIAGGASVSPYAAPARAMSLANLPPTYLATGGLDLFVDENIDYARRLICAGVPTELHVYAGAVHAFDSVPDAAVAKQARADSIVALQRALTAPLTGAE